MYFCAVFKENGMNKKTYYAGIMLFLCSFMALTFSCSKDEDYVEPTSDCYIRSMTLGTLTRYEYSVDENGESTSTTITYSGSYYPLQINQIEGTITNSIPLLLNTDRTIVPITLEGKGDFVYRPVNSEEAWVEFTSGNNIDFTTPVVFRANATDGESYRDYTVTLIIRDNDPDGYTWKQMMPVGDNASVLEGRRQRRAIAWNEGLAIVNADDAGALHVTITPTLEAQTWTDMLCTGAEGADIRTLQAFDNHMWMSTAEGALIKSDDGQTWNAVEQPANGTVRLLAATDEALYACINSAAICYSGNGTEWKSLMLDDDIALFPVDTFSTAYYKSSTSSVPRLAAIGKAGEDVVVWNKLLDEDEPWTLLSRTGDNEYTLPWDSLQTVNMVAYSNRLIAIGNTADTYRSTDNGLTWHLYTQFTLDDEKTADDADLVSATTAGEYIWLFTGARIWRARLNSYGE